MKRYLLPLALVLTGLAQSAHAQNWVLSIQDNTKGTSVNQVNGIASSSAPLYASILNFTGTAASDDGMGNPAPATTLDFAGFSFTQNPEQADIGSLFTADSRTPGFPSVTGSADGSTAGSSAYLVLGTFDLTTLRPGMYTEDFTASAYPSDINSTIPFDDIHGTLTLNVTSPSAVPEPSTGTVFGSGLVGLGLLVLRRRVRSV